MSAAPKHTADAEIQLPCLCALIRKAGRVVTRQYDGILKNSGLRITQYSMLMNIRLHPNLSVSGLSDLLHMDQTTVTRNLKVLERLGHVSIDPDSDDHRIRIIAITSQGRAVLNKTRSSWKIAQREVAATLGLHKTKALIKSLQQIIDA